MDGIEAVRLARERLAELTPLKRDCGAICGAACCLPDEDGQGGMLLFAGEETLYETLPAGFSMRRDDGIVPGGRLLVCSGRCERSERPLACRLFPLTPLLTEREGRERLVVRLDPRAFAVCPLCGSGIAGLDARFVDAVGDCARLLGECAEHRAYFRALARYFARLRAW